MTAMTETMRKLMVLTVSVATVLSAIGKDRVFFFVAHPDDIISSLGTCLLMRDRFELHVCD